MRRVLVAYDGSDGAKAAIEDLRSAGLGHAVEARVLSIADVWVPEGQGEESPFSDLPEFQAATEHLKEALREAREIAIEGARHLHQHFPEWSISNLSRGDSPTWGILAEARNWKPDLLVIGSHGRNPLERLFLGSVSFKVAAEAPCSVRVVRPQHHSRGIKLMLAIDGSVDSELAVDRVSQRQWHPSVEIDLVSVVDARLKARLLSRAGWDTEKSDNSLEQRVEAMQRRALQKLGALGNRAVSHSFEGDPKELLLRHAAKHDIACIFLGARGLEHGNRLYLGTLASAITGRAPCSVEICRP